MNIRTTLAFGCFLSSGLVACAAAPEPAPDDDAPAPSISDAGLGGGGGEAGQDLSSSDESAGAGGATIVLGSGGAGGFEACASASVQATRVPLDMYVMIDRSGSMEDLGKWTAVTQAIEIFAGAAKASDALAMGLQYFPLELYHQCSTSTDCLGGLCWSGVCTNAYGESCDDADYAKAAVPIAALPAGEAAIVSSLSSQSPGGSTPTAPALEGALGYASAWSAANPEHTTVVVLATDGMPTTCSPTSIGQIAAIAASGLADHGIATFVIGVGLAQQQLDAIAYYGGTGEALLVDTGGDTTAAFSAALAGVRHAAAGCDFALPSNATGDPTKVNVELTASSASAPQSLPKALDANDCGSALAWYYDDPTSPTKIRLCPAACSAFDASADATIDILLGCASIVK